jgi:hypothetical protein
MPVRDRSVIAGSHGSVANPRAALAAASTAPSASANAAYTPSPVDFTT